MAQWQDRFGHHSEMPRAEEEYWCWKTRKRREKKVEKASLDSAAAAAPSQPDRLDGSRSDHLVGSKESASWRALRREKSWEKSFFSLLFLFFQRQYSSSTCEVTSLLALFSCLSLFSAGSSWLLSHTRFFPFFLPLPTPVDRVSPNRCLKARHEADSFEPAEWSERLPSRRSGWLGAAAAGSSPAYSTFRNEWFLWPPNLPKNESLELQMGKGYFLLDDNQNFSFSFLGEWTTMPGSFAWESFLHRKISPTWEEMWKKCNFA